MTTSPLLTTSMAILPIRFFKIILKTNLERIKLPDKFAMRYGDGLPNPVFMKPPDGTEWEVYWAKQNHEVWFVKGWKKFVEYYSLEQGHLILFEYEGTPHIHVFIYDQSALQIDYPLLDELTDQKAKQMSGEKPAQRTSSLNWPRQIRAREVARNFISDNPFFTIFIKPSHVSKHQLHVPDLKGIIENKDMYVVLQLGERSYNVKFLARSQHSLSAGWSMFVRESELQPGDVCVFELIKTKDLVFKVNIFKGQS